MEKIFRWICKSVKETKFSPFNFYFYAKRFIKKTYVVLNFSDKKKYSWIVDYFTSSHYAKYVVIQLFLLNRRSFIQFSVALCFIKAYDFFMKNKIMENLDIPWFSIIIFIRKKCCIILLLFTMWTQKIFRENPLWTLNIFNKNKHDDVRNKQNNICGYVNFCNSRVKCLWFIFKIHVTISFPHWIQIQNI